MKHNLDTSFPGREQDFDLWTSVPEQAQIVEFEDPGP